MATRLKLKRGDTVRIISGHDKGIQGEVIRVLPRRDQVVIQGANIRKKHQRQIQTGGRTMNPGIIQFEAPMHVSNVMLVCPKCNEPTRVGVRREDGEAVRFCKQCEAEIDA